MPKRKKKAQASTEQSEAGAQKGYRLNFEPRSDIQRDTLKRIIDHDLTFIVGPTGTGKTFLATVAALRLLYNRKSPIKKIITIRPAVTAQEDIGFLPGDISEKLEQFLMPIYDHIIKLVGQEEFDHLMEKKKIEVIPVAYLRGRNFENAFVIVDEAQNLNIDQFKLVITRLSHGSKIAICGDSDQLDIPRSRSGLIDAIPRFTESPEPEVDIVYLPESEIQRHPLVSKILKKYQNPAIGNGSILNPIPENTRLVTLWEGMEDEQQCK